MYKRTTQAASHAMGKVSYVRIDKEMWVSYNKVDHMPPQARFNCEEEFLTI